MEDGFERIVTHQHCAIEVLVNGTKWSGKVPAEEVLLDFLRYRLGLTGTKRSCESQVCGACTVLVNEKPVSSCSYLAFEVDGQSVTSIEGLASGQELDPLQQAFIRNVGAQCGFCTSGQLMAAKGLLIENPSPTYSDVSEWMKGNICRCGCYPAIARSIMEAAEEYRQRRSA
ncbi:MAG: (2Fe-2S)-binding protein [Deltaproteobacteria bacterium]|nr:(2Fe-2S)-binding protein [Deltaproteobacteria bacterium]